MTYQLERWRDFYRDAEPIMRQHWEEIAIDREAIPYSLDVTKYEGMDDSGILHLLTMRDEGRLMGYYIGFCLMHPHYKDAGLMGFTDIYYTIPEARRAANGVELFIKAEETLKQRGCVKAYISNKLHFDIGPVFERLGWRASDRMYTKLL